MKNLNRVISLDRDEITELERKLYLKDLADLNEQYFECENPPSLEITRTEEGFLVCAIFTARRIKAVKPPQ